jgi:mono/diheme cytochrome c family protein
MAVGHSDGEILYRISVGVPGTAMPAWKSQLTEEERWDLLNYLKTLADPSEAAEYPEDD